MRVAQISACSRGVNREKPRLLCAKCAIAYATIAALPNNRYDYEMEKLLHLCSPRAVDMPEDGLDDTD